MRDEMREVREKIIITGMGVVSPIGVGKDDFYKALDEGKYGLKQITGFKTETSPLMYGGEITDFGASAYLGTKGLRHLTRGTKMLLTASHLALLNSLVRVRQKAFPHYNFIMPSSLTLQLVSITPDHWEGIIIGSTLGIFDSYSEFDRESIRSGWRGVDPMDFTNTVINAPAGQLAIKEKAEGLNLTISSGHASSTDALGMALHYLKTDQARVIFAGGATELGPCIYLMFKKAGFLCETIQDFNPVSENRSGTLLGEGSAVFILEKKEEAEKTGAAIIAEVEGYGTAFDAKSQQYKYDPEARAAIKAIRLALEDAGVKPEEIDFISSGLSGNPEGDEMELKAIREVFGPDILNIAIKSLIGETYDASGAFQLAAALYIFEKKVFLNNYTLNLPAPKKYYEPKRALITSFGFNGHNSALVVKGVM